MLTQEIRLLSAAAQPIVCVFSHVDVRINLLGRCERRRLFLDYNNFSLSSLDSHRYLYLFIFRYVGMLTKAGILKIHS